MAFELQVGTKVQGLDHNGHWEPGKIVDIFEGDKFEVSFTGWSNEYDLTLPRSHIRLPITKQNNSGKL